MSARTARKALTASAAALADTVVTSTVPSPNPNAESSPAAAVDAAQPTVRQAFATNAQLQLLQLPIEWEGVIAVENFRSDDGRFFESGALGWRELPLPLSYIPRVSEGHYDAELAGAITRIYRRGDEIWGAGVFDESEPAGMAAKRRVANGMMPWVSVDVGNLAVDIREDPASPPMQHPLFGEMPAMVEAYTRAKILGVTMVPHAALEPARISIVERTPSDPEVAVALAAALGVAGVPDKFASREITWTMPSRWITEAERQDESRRGIVASATDRPGFPVFPSREMYGDPALDKPTHVWVETRGKFAGEVVGHIALWKDTVVAERDAFHLGTEAWRRVTVPRSTINYSRFATGSVVCDDDTVVHATGVITVGCAHAPLGLSMREARQFYEQAGAGCADVQIGEDQFGIWVHGSMRSTATWAQVREINGSDLSGDWRHDDTTNGLELIGILGVVQGGFDVPGISFDIENRVLTASFGGGLSMSHRYDPQAFASLRTQVEQLSRELAAVRRAVQPGLADARRAVLRRRQR